jgi:hypothetical protein
MVLLKIKKGILNKMKNKNIKKIIELEEKINELQKEIEFWKDSYIKLSKSTSLPVIYNPYNITSLPPVYKTIVTW